jgi:hypothetical protein
MLKSVDRVGFVVHCATSDFRMSKSSVRQRGAKKIRKMGRILTMDRMYVVDSINSFDML